MIFFYIVFQIILYGGVFLATLVLVQYLLTWYTMRQYHPTVANVLKYLHQKVQPHHLQATWSESELEHFFATQLKKRFAQVTTQALIGGTQYARERIDIDLGEGQVGIEIKLANMLRKSNERNRLLGQIDLYLERKYAPKALLVLIVGSKKDLAHSHIEEIQRIIEYKKVTCQCVVVQ